MAGHDEREGGLVAGRGLGTAMHHAEGGRHARETLCSVFGASGTGPTPPWVPGVMF
jgi:hypothetical protein